MVLLCMQVCVGCCKEIASIKEKGNLQTEVLWHVVPLFKYVFDED